jgi:hypothetical protein
MFHVKSAVSAAHRLVAGVTALLSVATAHAAAPIVEDFFRLPAISGVRLSPSGQRLALVVPSPEGRTRLAVMDLPPTSPRAWWRHSAMPTSAVSAGSTTTG